MTIDERIMLCLEIQGSMITMLDVLGHSRIEEAMGPPKFDILGADRIAKAIQIARETREFALALHNDLGMERWRLKKHPCQLNEPPPNGEKR